MHFSCSSLSGATEPEELTDNISNRGKGTKTAGVSRVFRDIASVHQSYIRVHAVWTVN